MGGPNPEAETGLLLPCILSLIQVIQMVSSHFNSKKEDFLKILDPECESSDEVLEKLADATIKRVTEIQDSLDHTEDNEDGVSKIIGGYFKLLDVLTREIEENNQEVLKKVYDWMKRYCEKCSTTNADVFKPGQLFIYIFGKVNCLFTFCVLQLWIFY